MRGLETALIRMLAGVIGGTCLASSAWSHGSDNSHRDRLQQAIEPDDVYELSLVLIPEQQLRYGFKTTQQLDFNIHHHASHEAFYPVPVHQAASTETSFAAESEQEDCLM